MELALNLVWLAMATSLLVLWLRGGKAAVRTWVVQMISVAALLLILFPAISVTDDLQAAQTMAETDTSLRRCHEQALASTHIADCCMAISAIFEFTGIPVGTGWKLTDEPAEQHRVVFQQLPESRPPPVA